MMALAYRHKRDHTKAGPEVRRLAASMTLAQLRDFAATPRKGLPQKKG